MKSICHTFLLTAVVAGAAGAADGPPPGSKEAFLKLCSSCHKQDVVSGRRTRSQWEDTIEKMIARGAKGSDEEFLLTLDYLLSQHGRVNVNNATANELVEILSISRDEADAIVKYRRANGRFEDFDALSKVPGVDAQKLIKNREAISF